MEIREEIEQDIPLIFEINDAAFGRSDEALLVDRLRAVKAIICSLIAIRDGQPLGHALFTPLLLHNESGVVAVLAALGPVAVLPAYQRQGIGQALIDQGIRMCRDSRYRAMLVLGHPSYYPRFGFRPASRFNIFSAYEDVPDDAFMALELEEGALETLSGVAHYHPQFDGV